MTHTFAPPLGKRGFDTARVRELAHPEPQPNLSRASGYLVVDLRGRLVGRVEGPTFAGPGETTAVLPVSFGFLWLRRCLVGADSIDQIDDATRVISLRIGRQSLRAGRA